MNDVYVWLEVLGVIVFSCAVTGSVVCISLYIAKWRRKRARPWPKLSIRGILGDPAASYWLKDALSSSLDRDPVDAANDAEVLAKVLATRARRILSEIPQTEKRGLP